MDAELLDRPVGQGLRAQQSQPPTATTIVLLSEDAVAAGIVGRPLTHARPVEQPTSGRPLALVPWTSLTLTATSLVLTGATLAILSLPAAVGAMVTLCTAVCCVALVAAEVMSKAAR